MVSLWPWKGDNTSPASFEKALSSLSARISKTNAQLESLRQRQRRFKALWTLYTIFAYILYSIILALVVGWRNWGIAEYAAVAGGPVLIYLARRAITTYYNYRISNVQSYSEDLQTQRNTTIDKLKAATKYNTTQELLEKYGGAPKQSPKPSSSPSGTPSRKPGSNQGSPTTPRGGRTGFAPPPTANIPRNNPAIPQTPQRGSPSASSPLSRQILLTADVSSGSAEPGPPEFAPNAFPAPAQYSSSSSGLDQPNWYDRMMDLLLGEDENLPKNRLALICNSCKLVNGQAPPGVKRLEDVGKWRCSGCGGWNGEESEARTIVAEIHKQAAADVDEKHGGVHVRKSPSEESSGGDDEILPEPSLDNEDHGTQKIKAHFKTLQSEKPQEGTEDEDETEDGSGNSEPEPSPPPRPKRGRPKGSVKKI
ncbi:MAG: hypothetical protein M1827_005935 [Pycnora praestabilis]|nr:MAG: hypothetical protein M1827_005935 [Pycnora praestabilis]